VDLGESLINREESLINRKKSLINHQKSPINPQNQNASSNLVEDRTYTCQNAEVLCKGSMFSVMAATPLVQVKHHQADGPNGIFS